MNRRRRLPYLYALLLLSVVRTTAYDYGEDVTLCWAKRADKRTSEREDCQGADVLWGASGESDSSAVQSKLLSSVLCTPHEARTPSLSALLLLEPCLALLWTRSSDVPSRGSATADGQ